MGSKNLSDKALESELADTVRRLYKSDDGGQLTVNYARQVVEEQLGLPRGFFKTNDWKERSKNVVHNTVTEVELAVSGPSSPVSAPPKPKPKAPRKETKPKPQPKKTSSKKGPAAKKRAKKESTPDEDTDSGLSSLTSIDDIPKTTKRKLLSGRGKKRRVVSDDDEDSAEASTVEFVSSSEDERPRKKTKPEDWGLMAEDLKDKDQKKTEIDSELESPLSEVESDPNDTGINDPAELAKAKPDEDESEMSEVIDEAPKRKIKKSKENVPEPEDVDGSDTSEVFDEPPKRKRRSKDEAPRKGRKAQTAAKASPANQSPDDALIKQLQGQLVKCGVRKVWGNELKKYGDDKKAKTRHLKSMLVDIGMTGRFSDSKAKEIKERRELMADLDAVMEGEKNWGVSKGRLARRRAAVKKSLKESSEDVDDSEEKPRPKNRKDSSNDDNEDDESTEDEDAQPAVHRKGPAKRRAGLAFLGDESESD